MIKVIFLIACILLFLIPPKLFSNKLHLHDNCKIISPLYRRMKSNQTYINIFRTQNKTCQDHDEVWLYWLPGGHSVHVQLMSMV